MRLANRIEHLGTEKAFAVSQAAREWAARGINKVLLSGIEAHVCVQQTVCDALAAGLAVYVAVDAIGARHAIDHDTALRRMESYGATLTTTESVLFEWCETAERPEFKKISELIREQG